MAPGSGDGDRSLDRRLAADGVSGRLSAEQDLLWRLCTAQTDDSRRLKPVIAAVHLDLAAQCLDAHQSNAVQSAEHGGIVCRFRVWLSKQRHWVGDRPRLPDSWADLGCPVCRSCQADRNKATSGNGRLRADD